MVANRRGPGALSYQRDVHPGGERGSDCRVEPRAEPYGVEPLQRDDRRAVGAIVRGAGLGLRGAAIWADVRAGREGDVCVGEPAERA